MTRERGFSGRAGSIQERVLDVNPDAVLWKQRLTGKGSFELAELIRASHDMELI
jgi:hypothetical protein